MIVDSQSKATGPERRGAPRMPAQGDAVISFAGTSVGCAVRNISRTGIVVSLPKWQIIPNDVGITLAGEENTRPAVVVRTLKPNIALHFTDATD